MKSSENSLRCDYCGDIVKDDFTYYSFDFHKVNVTNNVKSISTDNILSVDLDEECMELYRDRLKKAYSPPKVGIFKCDISGESFVGSTFTYYYCKITKIIVKLSDQPYTCNTCNKIVDVKKLPCEHCTNETVVSRVADVTTDDRYLELNFSDSMFQKFKEHIDYVKNRGDLEWATA